ncbi:Hypothetical predicted protein [Pelobates cultripes]|uniref:Myb-like domain-containing protein n=1 Tax=Pelobates cultripes TaxID=61616 RepID=A0AAD1WSG1_PELCU|nr:Hypothetical predicted protein [Pelobates cultripes]
MAAIHFFNTKKRNGKFNEGENEILVRQIMANWKKIYMRNACSLQEKKIIWENITRKVNKRGTYVRTTTACKKRWNDFIRSIEKSLNQKLPLNHLQSEVFQFVNNKNNGNKITWEKIVLKIGNPSTISHKQTRKPELLRRSTGSIPSVSTNGPEMLRRSTVSIPTIPMNGPELLRRSTGSIPSVSTNGPEMLRRSAGSISTVPTVPRPQTNVETALEKYIWFKNNFEKEKNYFLSSSLKQMEEHRAKVASYLKELSKMIDGLKHEASTDSDYNCDQNSPSQHFPNIFG